MDRPAFSKQLRRLIRDSIRLSKRRPELSAERFASRRRRLGQRLHELLARPWEEQLRRHEAMLMSVFHTLKQRGHNPVSAVLDAVHTSLRIGPLPPLPSSATVAG